MLFDGIADFTETLLRKASLSLSIFIFIAIIKVEHSNNTVHNETSKCFQTYLPYCAFKGIVSPVLAVMALVISDQLLA